MSHLNNLANAGAGDSPTHDHDRVQQDDRHFGAPGVSQTARHNLLPEQWENASLITVLGIRIRMIRMSLGLPDPDPLVRGTGTDPEPSIFS
jgi:hypothetical protein